MSGILRNPMTLAEFLRWEERQELRYEFDGSLVVRDRPAGHGNRRIQRYVVLQQTHKVAIVIVRREDGWLSEIVSGTGASLDLPQIGVSVPLQEVYANAGLADEGEEGGR
jgi:hypothetical protein